MENERKIQLLEALHAHHRDELETQDAKVQDMVLHYLNEGYTLSEIFSHEIEMVKGSTYLCIRKNGTSYTL